MLSAQYKISADIKSALASVKQVYCNTAFFSTDGKSMHICRFANKKPFNSWTKLGRQLEFWMKFWTKFAILDG